MRVCGVWCVVNSVVQYDMVIINLFLLFFLLLLLLLQVRSIKIGVLIIYKIQFQTTK